jgi:sugar phosphate isomerase/epimerase
VQRLSGLIEGINSGSIGIHFNPASLILADHYQIDSIRHCASWVRSVTVRDATRDLGLRRGVEVPIGRGSAEFPEILGVLDEAQYRGWFIIDRHSSGRPIQEYSDAIAFLRAL